MNRPVLRLVEDAENEFYDIIEYYKEFDSDLPYDFLNEFEQAIERLLAFLNLVIPIYITQSVYF